MFGVASLSLKVLSNHDLVGPMASEFGAVSASSMNSAARLPSFSPAVPLTGSVPLEKLSLPTYKTEIVASEVVLGINCGDAHNVLRTLAAL